MPPPADTGLILRAMIISLQENVMDFIWRERICKLKRTVREGVDYTAVRLERFSDMGYKTLDSSVFFNLFFQTWSLWYCFF